jgi:hypothetical protein
MVMHEPIQSWKRALVAAAWLLLAGPAWAAGIFTNATIVNVTPSGFSVVAAVSPASSASDTTIVSVFADPAGATNLAGQVGVELYPLNSGNPTATNDYARQQSMTALRQESMALGLIHARVSDCAPATTYYFQISLFNSGNLVARWPSNSLASVTTAKENAFAVQSDELLVTVNAFQSAGSILMLFNTNTETVLAAVVGDGAPTNQAFFSINDLISLNGKTNFAPLGDQTFVAKLLTTSSNNFAQDYSLILSTNFLVGQGAQFSVGQAFSIVAFGQDVAKVGSSSSVPIFVTSGSALANFSFSATVPANLFTNLSVQADSPLINVASVKVVSSNSLLFNFQAATGENLNGNTQIAHLNFTTLSNTDSAFVPLLPQALHGTNTDFSTSPLFAQAGRVVVVGLHPLLDTAVSGGARSLILYALPGESYEIQSSTTLRGPASWANLLLLGMTNLEVTIPNLDPSPRAIFYRAAQFTADQPDLQPAFSSGSNRSLLVFGHIGTNYTLQTTANLSGTVVWTPLLTYKQTNSFQIITNVGSSSPAFYRIKR